MIQALLTHRLRNSLLSRLIPNGKCMEFSGFCNEAGYGIIACAGKRLLAHRVAWVIANERDVPEGKIICHRCNNPRCCNPRHLYAGTYRDNADDRLAADREQFNRKYRPLLGVTGSNHPRGYSKDKRRQAILMRQESRPFKEIADVLGCRRQTVERWWAEHLKALSLANILTQKEK
jgi:transposase-like protein